jgi:hypothetical protein
MLKADVNELRNLVQNYFTWSAFIHIKGGGLGISYTNTSNLHVRNIKTTHITLPGWREGRGGRVPTTVASFPKYTQYTATTTTTTSPVDIHPFSQHINPLVVGVSHEGI